MPPPNPQLDEIRSAIKRYDNNERPWPDTLNRIDWFIVFDGGLYPLKYIYALATNIRPVRSVKTETIGQLPKLHG